MATSSPSRVLTLSEMTSLQPTLRLTLTNKATQLAASKPTNSAVKQCLGRAKAWASNMFQDAEASIKLESDENSSTKTQMNKDRLKKIFDQMRDKLDQQEATLADEMDGLTSEQQDQLLNYWSAVQGFFMDMFDYLRKIFDYVLEKIVDGFTVVKDAIKGFFDEALAFLKLIF